MISKKILEICKDYKNIENYQEAINDKENMWHCHHRLELHPDGSIRFTRKSLKKLDLYYNRPASELIFLKSKIHLSIHKNHREWTDEQKLQKSKHMKELWKKRAFRRKVKEGVAERREQGKNLVNIAQMESDQNYRDYQRLQHRDWYDRNRAKWNAYNKRHKMRDKSIEELIALRDKHLANAHFIEELLLEREQNDA